MSLMVSEEKVKLMTRLALYEQNESKSIKSGKFFRNDYIGLHMLMTALLATIAYILLVLIVAIYKTDYLMDNITQLDAFGLGKKLVLIYIAFLIIYMLLAYIVYSVKFRVMQDNNKTYAECLKKLCKVYRREQQENNDSKIGGPDSDDETFDF